MTIPLFIGTLLYDHRQYSRILPKAVAADGAWTQPEDWSAYFPTEGRVYAPRKPAEIAAGELFAFDVVESQARERGPDQFHLGNYFVLEELLDMRHLRSEEARRKLVETGVQRSGKVEDVVVALAEGRCVRLRLKPAPDGVRSVADVDGLEALTVYELSPENFENSRVDRQHFVIPNVTVGREIGVVDWSLDIDFLERVLHRMRRTASAGTLGQSFPQSRAQIKSVVSALQRADLLPANGEDLQAMRDRLKDFSDQLPANIRNLEEAIRSIAAMSGMKERLARLEVSERARVQVEVRESVEREVREHVERESGGLGARLEALRKEVDVAVGNVADASKALESLRSAKAAIKTELDGLVTNLREALTEDEKDGPRSRTELASRIEKVLAGQGLLVDLSGTADAPWTWQSEDIEATPTSWDEFPDRLRSAAKLFGFEPADLDIADKIARAGMMVVFPQQVAHDFLRCYATAIAAGAFAVQALDPSVVGLSDIWREPGFPRQTPFARAWRRSIANPSRFHIVLLDGLDRTPIDLWLPSLAKVLDAADRPKNLLVAGCLSGRSIDATRHIADPFWNFVPCSPRLSDDPAGSHIARALGRRVQTHWLDASIVPETGGDRAAAFLSSLGALPTLSAKNFALRLASTIEQPDLAIRICRAMGGEPEPAEDVAAVTAGREWFKKLQ